jgi:Cd2+/Zn2+-exporting ATPase
MSQALAERPNATADLLRVKIAGMDCGSCAMTIESSMRQLQGVRSVSVSFTTEQMEITGDAALPVIEARLKELGYRIASDAPAKSDLAGDSRGAAGFARFLWQQGRLRVALLVTAAVIIGVPLLAGVPAFGTWSALDLLFVAAVVIPGIPVLIKGTRALVFGRRVTIDLLMSVAAVGALAIGETGEAVTVILLYTLGEALEAYSAERARGSLRSLMSLQPDEATVLREHRGGHGEEEKHDHDDHGHDDGHGHDHHDHHDDDYGHEHAHDDHGDCGHDHHVHDEHAHEPEPVHFHSVVVPVAAVAIGETVLVRPGQRIPVDGVVSSGTSSINQAAVTGESIPVVRGSGDEVMAGTVNGEGALEIRVTRAAGDATIARIARLVEQAQSERSPAERFIDRFARGYTPAVVALACLVVAIPVLAFGQPLLDGADGTHGWLYRALALLIIACPCALVISIPVTVVSSLTRLANLGVLVKGGAQLDRLADVRAIAFDKTGTLTHGRPRVTAVRSSDCDHVEEDYTSACDNCDDVVALAASVERSSEHPVAHAIVAAASGRQLSHRYQAAGGVTAHAGRGIVGQLGNGMTVAVGSDALFAQAPDGHAVLSTRASGARDAGNTVMYVARNDKVIGYIGVQDEVRDASSNALRELGEADPPVAAVMLMGDNPQAAARVAARVGHIADVRAGLLPEQKLAAIEELHRRYGSIAMVGDGINDAPALARADVGIAMGAGTAQAMETADVVLMQDDISHVPMALRIARRSRALVKQNIALSLGLKLVFLALAVPGITTLWMAVLADVGATLLVTLNGMRVLRES